MSTIRIGVAGLGRMGAIHAENLARLPQVEVAGVVDARGETARAIGERLGVAWSSDYDMLLRDPDIDGVVVATPTKMHSAMVASAAAAGKHVLCEKPIASDHGDAVRALEAVHRAGVKLQAGFHRRFDPDWTAMARRIGAGEIGKIVLFRASLRDRCAPGPDYLRHSGDIFVDVAIHELDAARWMIGEVEEVAAFGGVRLDADAIDDVSTALVFLRFAGGAIGVIDTTRVAGYGYEASTEVMGTRATLRLANDRATHVEMIDTSGASRDWVQDWAERHRDAYRLEAEGFVAAIRDDTEPAVTGADALAASVLAQACTTAMCQQRKVRLDVRDGPFGIEYSIAESQWTSMSLNTEARSQRVSPESSAR